MNSFLESKLMARALRSSLAERGITLSHSACLELVARQFGFSDWNVLSAQIETATKRHKALPLPAGWFPTGSADPMHYRMGLDGSAPGTALIEYIADKMADTGKARFASMMQSIDAGQYHGTRIRLSAVLRTENADCGTIWMRIDGPENRRLHFDNMMSRKQHGAISGTTGWTSRSIVLNVPVEAASIHYGFFLKGRGKVWARNFNIERVCETAEVTEIPLKTCEPRVLPQRPENLDFRDEIS